MQNQKVVNTEKSIILSYFVNHKNTLTFMQVNVHAEPDAQSEGVNANLSWCKDTGGHLQILMHKNIGFKSHNID